MVFVDATGYLRVALAVAVGTALAAVGAPGTWGARGALVAAIAGCGLAVDGDGSGARIWAMLASLAAAYGIAGASFAAAEKPAPLGERLGEQRLRGVVRGEVVGGPEPLRGGWGVEVRLETIDGEQVRTGGRSVRFFLEGRPLGGGEVDGVPMPGDRIETFARLEQYPRQRFPGLPGSRWRIRNRGVEARAVVLDETVERLERLGGPVRVLRRHLAGMRTTYLARVAGALETDRAAYVLAMSAGARGLLEADQSGPFERTGTAHLLAISGLHLGVLAWMVWKLLAVLVGAFPQLLRRFGRRRVCALPMLVLLAGYVWTIGAPVSAVRAWLMVAAVAAAHLSVRPVDSFHALATALLAVLVWEPAQIASLGCHLSFAATGAILGFLRRRPPSLEAAAEGDDEQGWTVRWARRAGLGAGVSLSATLATWPVLFAWNGAVPVDGLWTNLVVTPLASAAIIPATFAGATLSALVPVLGEWLLWWGGGGMELLARGLGALADLPPHSLVTGQLSGPALGLLVLGVGAVVGSRARLRPLAVGAGLVAAVVASAIAWRGVPAGELRVHFIPVGQGDATLVEFPDGGTMLVDGGGRRLGSDPGRETIVPYLHRLGIGRLDRVLATHADIDHVGGLEAVAERMRPREFLYPPVDGVRRLCEVAAKMADRGAELVRVRRGRRLEVGEARVQTVRPAPGGGLEGNDVSLVTRVAYAGRRVVLPGDIEERGERWYVERCRRRGCGADVLKVPHHGSATSSTGRFLAAIEPSVAVVSAGKFNPFGHPAESVLARYRRREVPVVETARRGLVRVAIRRSGRLETRVMRREEP